MVQGQPVRFLRGGKVGIRGVGSQTRRGGFAGHAFNINEDHTTFGTVPEGYELNDNGACVTVRGARPSRGRGAGVRGNGAKTVGDALRGARGGVRGSSRAARGVTGGRGRRAK